MSVRCICQFADCRAAFKLLQLVVSELWNAGAGIENHEGLTSYGLYDTVVTREHTGYHPLEDLLHHGAHRDHKVGLHA